MGHLLLNNDILVCITKYFQRIGHLTKIKMYLYQIWNFFRIHLTSKNLFMLSLSISISAYLHDKFLVKVKFEDLIWTVWKFKERTPLSLIMYSLSIMLAYVAFSLYLFKLDKRSSRHRKDGSSNYLVNSTILVLLILISQSLFLMNVLIFTIIGWLMIIVVMFFLVKNIIGIIGAFYGWLKKPNGDFDLAKMSLVWGIMAAIFGWIIKG